jgi:hypothetical protein
MLKSILHYLSFGKLKSILHYFGFEKEQRTRVLYQHSYTFHDTLDLKLAYLKALSDQEDSRQDIIESKASQITGQSGIIFSLLSLFIANYISRLTDLPLIFQIVLIIVFLISLFLYLNTIFQATKNLNITKYAYAQRSVTTVQAKFNSEEDFKVEEIKDLIFSIEKNTGNNNLKSNNLIYAYRSFTLGTIFIGLLAVLLIFSSYWLPKEKAKETRTAKNAITGQPYLMRNKLTEAPVFSIYYLKRFKTGQFFIKRN